MFRACFFPTFDVIFKTCRNHTHPQGCQIKSKNTYSSKYVNTSDIDQNYNRTRFLHEYLRKKINVSFFCTIVNFSQNIAKTLCWNNQTMRKRYLFSLSSTLSPSEVRTFWLQKLLFPNKNKSEHREFMPPGIV